MATTRRWIFRSLWLSLWLLAAPAAQAQQTQFDFEAPGPDQQGSYVPDPGAELAGGVAQLRPEESPAWHSPGWGYRLGVRVTNLGSVTLTDHPVRIELAGGPDVLFDAARLDGADLLPVLASTGAAVSPRWVESLDFISRTGALWVRLPSLPPGVTELLVYFGNPAWVDGGSPEVFFSRAGGWITQCVVSPLAAQELLHVESFVDGNVVSLEGGTASLTLETRATGTFDPADLGPGTFLRATGPFYGTFEGADSDALVPMTFAATRLVVPSIRYEDRWDVVAPYGDALVEIYDNDVLLTAVTVQEGTPVTIQADVADLAVARVEADRPVLVHHHAWYTTTAADYDAHVVVPPAPELLGASSGTTRLVAAQDNTQVDVWYSTGTRESFVLNRTDVRTLQGAGTQGSGAAARIQASGPVMAISSGDGDGGEAVSFLPTRELGRRFLLPLGAQYLLVATLGPATRCEILDAAGQAVASQQSDTYGANYPGQLLFLGVAAGHELACSGPAWAMFEDPATDTERNLWPIQLHRPRAEREPTATLDAVQPRYAATRGTVVTPTYVAPYAVGEWTAFVETATVPTGTWLRYQLSEDDGQSWLFYDGDQWTDASRLEAANPWWEVHLNLDTFPVASNRLTVRAILGSADGAASPALDALDVYYRQEQTATRFVFEAVSSPQWAGRPFSITIQATDALGHPIQGFQGFAYLQTLGGQTSPAETPAFVNGRVTFEVAVAEVGAAVQLYAFAAAINGTSDPFEVRAPTGARIERVSGDQQFGLAGLALPEPLRARVLDENGDPAAAVPVIFAVTSGDGTVLAGAQADAEISVLTGPDGVAEVTWQLGPRAGANRAEARLAGAEGSPVSFEARGDRNPDLDHWEIRGEGGGCACTTSGAPGSGAPGPGALLALCALAWLWRRRGRPPVRR